ncbi:uncharacterized protein BDR25DRAFT_290439 [Lindgomyces ingoldianus]|uniref:Uncharacterized protein n=1 Tax=Lindgomyces ingoldianus TaxID=673940 RepID=A0ACB6QNP7_9PLEO|nr:uncharacterized protein BDR25DRAFT_290439 [Lindgomyces ingoldianus]KAF2468644.1 hypothetical protein BDR25DRAFT_290439 [Lindgomyces ingoldianus]
MSTHQSAAKYRIYPAYCFTASPTYNVWVKLTAADVQALRTEPQYRSQHIYFNLNYPIRYVCIVGTVVAIDDINLKYTVLTIDDGSGATVEVKIVRLTPDIYNSVESPSNTTIGNVNVIVRTGCFEVTVDHQQVDIGSVIKAKCTISEFRGMKQLEIKRVWIVPTTNEEVQAWAETAAFKREVLSKPWHLTSAEHKKIKKEIKRERRKNQEYERLKVEHEARRGEQKKAWEEYMEKREARLEARRRKEEVMMNAGALI